MTKAMALCAAAMMLTVGGMAQADVMQDGGDRLAELQLGDGGWEWTIGSGTSSRNIAAPIAMGLLAAYDATTDAAFLNGAIDAGNYIMASDYHSTGNGIFMSALSLATGDSSYANDVTMDYYDRFEAGTYMRDGSSVQYGTTEYAQFIADIRLSSDIPNLAAWDIGLAAVGAAKTNAAPGELNKWAAALKTSVSGLVGETYDDSYTVTGLAGGLYGLAVLGADLDAPISGGYLDGAQTLTDLGDLLVSFQAPAGGFAKFNIYVDDGYTGVQETAAAILALQEVDPMLYASEIADAQAWLRSVQLGTGGWSAKYAGADVAGWENSEVTGEALWALSVPEPTTLSLLVLGGVAILRRRR